jgi:antitoxin component of MazEF toxin-antitoxin module
MSQEIEVKEWGNSLAVIIPAEKVRELGLKKGDAVEVEVIPKKRIDGFGIAISAKRFKEETESHREFW